MKTAQTNDRIGLVCRREIYHAWGGDVRCYRVRRADGSLVTPAASTPTTARAAWAEISTQVTR